MKKIALLLMMGLVVLPVCAEEYLDDYTEYAEYDVIETSTNNKRYETYLGLRVHKNESLALKYDIHSGRNSTIREDNFGIGAVIGNRLSNHVMVEFETAYTGIEKNKRGRGFDFDIWANMFNVYFFQEYADAIAPYAGVGIGFASIWGDVDTVIGNMSDSVFDLSYQAMIGVNFALNNRVDLNLGIKYQYYGEVEHNLNGSEFAVTDVDATEFYFGAAYKFGL